MRFFKINQCDLPGHDYKNNISVVAIEKVFPENDTLLRRRREQFWIKTYI